MPTIVNDTLISWASDIDPGTIRQAEKTARLPIVAGRVALMPDAHIGFGRETRRINCHHNFTKREVHHGTELWITRTRAIKADQVDLVEIRHTLHQVLDDKGT